MREDIFKYFKEIKDLTPVYYHWKERDQAVIDYLYNQKSNLLEMRGDMECYYSR